MFQRRSRLLGVAMHVAPRDQSGDIARHVGPLEGFIKCRRCEGVDSDVTCWQTRNTSKVHLQAQAIEGPWRFRKRVLFLRFTSETSSQHEIGPTLMGSLAQIF
jgi:hypothetical protein